MARPWRIQFENAVYHITARGNHNQDIFLDDQDRMRFLGLVGRTCERFSFKVYSFCLMDNHFHLFLQTPLGNLSKGMHWLNGTYTGYFNHRHKTFGHLLQGRFKSVLVADDVHYLHLSMYIHLNPVRAGLVERPGRYPWSSFSDYLRLKPRFKWLNPGEILGHYGTSRSRRVRSYARECMGLIGVKPAFAEQLKTRVILGSTEKTKELIKKYRPSGKIKAVSDFSAEARNNISINHELGRVAALFGVKAEDLRRRQRDFTARQAAYYHLVEHCGVSVVETAEVLGVSVPGVSLGISRLQERLRNDQDLKKRIGQLCYM